MDPDLVHERDFFKAKSHDEGREGIASVSLSLSLCASHVFCSRALCSALSPVARRILIKKEGIYLEITISVDQQHHSSSLVADNRVVAPWDREISVHPVRRSLEDEEPSSWIVRDELAPCGPDGTMDCSISVSSVQMDSV